MNNKEIPIELKDLVSKSVKLLGLAIKDIYGVELYNFIESLRVKMKGVRAKDADTVHHALEMVYLNLRNEKTAELRKIAKAFSLMLEVINGCEAAYRTYRLKEKKFSHSLTPHSLVFVFTSHPTEARSREFLFLSDKVEMLLLRSLEEGFSNIEDKLLHLLRIALRVDLANNRRPQVKDEAEQIFHTVLDEKILLEQIALKRLGVEVYFRTWVGGDKDGHPKVGPTTMLQTLSLGRAKLLSFIHQKLKEYEVEISMIGGEARLQKHLKALNLSLKALATIKAKDGKTVKDFRTRLTSLIKKSKEDYLLSPSLEDIEHLIWLYPALVLPLEIREDQGLVHEALKRPLLPIARMLALLKKISQGLEAKWYVRGFVISMCQSSEDLVAGLKLTKKMCGQQSLPVVPLFENEKGLSDAVNILRQTFIAVPNLKDEHHKRWGGRFEVMLGYSDSSKENGVFPGRLMVEKTLFEIESFLLGEALTPVFFHGSGGSVSRGGGSIREQIAWLPQTALNIYKVTVQGETVQRHFHQPLIMRSQVNKIVQEFASYRPKPRITAAEVWAFSRDIQESYKGLVQDQAFQELTTLATPYDFLNLLKIGSRPTKRSSKGKFSLRAIPWILCWTQTRLLLPIWWGIGTAWQHRTPEEKEEIKKYHEVSPLMQSFVKNLGFTLAKVEMGVWKFHVDHAKLPVEEKQRWYDLTNKEMELTKVFFKDVTGGADFTWYNPRLGQSIIFRSSMIHPLNVIQKISLERNDHILLRETVTGIACGMLTTG